MTRQAGRFWAAFIISKPCRVAPRRVAPGGSSSLPASLNHGAPWHAGVGRAMVAPMSLRSRRAALYRIHWLSRQSSVM
jgi:hypothetical protein